MHRFMRSAVGPRVEQHRFIIGGKTWREVIFRICRVIGHRFPSDSRGQGRPGSFNVCHVGKQLIAFFLSKDCFLNKEIENRSPRDLYYARPSVSLQAATIPVSTAVCNDRDVSARKIEHKFGLPLRLEHREGNIRA